MWDHAIATLEFDRVRHMLMEHAASEGGKRRALQLEPLLNMDQLGAALRETQGAKALIEHLGAPPLAMMEGLAAHLILARQGGLLSPEALSDVAQFLNTCRRLRQYLEKGEVLRIELSLNGRALLDVSELQREIEGAIRGSEVVDSASSALRDVRRKIRQGEDQVKQRLARLLQGHKDWFADSYVSMRGGRSTLPVKAQYRAKVPGPIIDRSQTGGTLFIEPDAVKQAQDALSLLLLDEENEVRRVLYALSAQVEAEVDAIESNMRLMERLDFAFAKAQLALEMDAILVPVTRERRICIRAGRHPLLPNGRCVPLDFAMDGTLSGVVVTGPNTGGKTVALKAIGLLSLMAQCGLFVPAEEGSTLSMRDCILTDIGDGQSIQENLSTFSAHMKQVLQVLRHAGRDSLVLLDELGSGTDPAEGMGLAVAVLEALSQCGCLFVVTTHYPQIKSYAQQAPGVINARMAFDPENFEPLYKLILGEAGESCALLIARRLGFPEALLERAHRAAHLGEHGPNGDALRLHTEATPRIQTYRQPQTLPERALKFGRGDSVRVYPEGIVGIVYQPSDEHGQIGVQLRGRKKQVPYKRLRLIAPAEQMYPDDYDFSIVFDSVENRKARHIMEKRHDPSAIVRE